MIKNLLEDLIQSVLFEKYPKIDQFRLEIPNNIQYGDYSANYSFLLAKELKNNPNNIAHEISDFLNNNEKICKRIKAHAINGFINIKLNDNELWANFIDLFEKKVKLIEKKQKILLEFVSANPTGPLHIGHGRWAVIGDVLANLLKYVGNDLEKEFYINDAGTQIDLFNESVNAVKKGNEIPENGYHGAYIHELAKLNEDPVDVMIKHQKEVLNKLDLKFDNWFSEKTLHSSEKVKKVLEILEKKDLTYLKDKAAWFKSTKYGDNKDRVLIKADGSYTYFAVDIAYHWEKLKRGFDLLINIWGADHHGYIDRMLAAIKALSGRNEEVCKYFKILVGQLVTLLRNGEIVRMSKRTGEIITLEEVIDEIGSDATRFFLIQKSSDTHLDFDLELAKKQSSENPVYYIQYAHARICSILRKIDQEKIIVSKMPGSVNLNPPERMLVLALLRIHDEILEAAKTLSIHKIAYYALNFAKLFHVFYEKCPIIKANEKDIAKRVEILNKTKQAIKLCLELLGISVPDKM